MFNSSTIPTDYELTTVEFSLLQLNARSDLPPKSTAKHSLKKNDTVTSIRHSSLDNIPIAQLVAGQVAWLTTDRTKKYPDVYGVITHPALILKRLSPKYLVVAPLFEKPHYSSLFPPITIDGHPYYVAIPKIRFVMISHLTSAHLVGQLGEYPFNAVIKQITTFLTP